MQCMVMAFWDEEPFSMLRQAQILIVQGYACVQANAHSWTLFGDIAGMVGTLWTLTVTGWSVSVKSHWKCGRAYPGRIFCHLPQLLSTSSLPALTGLEILETIYQIHRFDRSGCYHQHLIFWMSNSMFHIKWCERLAVSHSTIETGN